jgi:succinate dehydrogenase/fumarate reductase-like Fe-S protein
MFKSVPNIFGKRLCVCAREILSNDTRLTEHNKKKTNNYNRGATTRPLLRALGYYNEYHMSGSSEQVKTRYWRNMDPENHAQNCIACGIFEEKCPQQLSVSKFMNEAVKLFHRPRK